MGKKINRLVAGFAAAAVFAGGANLYKKQADEKVAELAAAAELCREQYIPLLKEAEVEAPETWGLLVVLADDYRGKAICDMTGSRFDGKETIHVQVEAPAARVAPAQ